MPYSRTELTERFRRNLPSEYLAVVTMIALAMVLPGQPSTSMLVILGTLALGAAIASRWSRAEPAIDRMIRLGAFGIVFLAVYSLWVHTDRLGQLVDRPYAVEFAWAVPLVAVGIWVAWAIRRIDDLGERAFRAGLVCCIVAIAWTIAAEGASANLSPVKAVDVIELNEAGAEALWAGRNPYTDVVVPKSSPFAEPGDVIEGYFYTPTVLVTYATSWKLFGDARWASVLAVGAFVALLLWPTLRGTRRFALGVVAAVSVFIANPSFELMISYGWTDFLALPLLAGSAALWRRQPVASAVLLGAALSTKEYFIVLLPVLLLVSDPDRWKRLAYAGGVVVLTYLPFAVVDLGVLVPRYLKLVGSDRPDSLGLNGYGISVPVWLSVLLAIGCAVWVGRRVDTLATMFLGFATVMAVTFLTGVQAFVNYWIAVSGVVLIALWLWLREADDEARNAAPSRQREAVG